MTRTERREQYRNGMARRAVHRARKILVWGIEVRGQCHGLPVVDHFIGRGPLPPVQVGSLFTSVDALIFSCSRLPKVIL
jgi:hypothetical protein